MLTVVALYTLLSTTFCLNFTFAYTISSSSTTSFSSSSSFTPSTTTASGTLSSATMAATAAPSTEHKHHKRRYEGKAKGYEETIHRIGIFVTSSSTTTTRTMSTMTTTMTDGDDNEQFISSVRDLQIGFSKFIQFFNVEMEENYQIEFLDYEGN